ncbi:universal stress protein UspA [Halorubrum sp. JWXQ-INN 858]|uniref:universal stress protein n=1 Tax=Halorubrum sp. JWXQ-INN 858 TaxID=2690782 RepID=UPI00135A809B|nr:universal stress protein [Halorubrum sp. JWXQ-INN 858]MWV65422.1 universal stress protein UspA [Halorubrum sp. JWXQ-INN 858]
MSSHDADGTVLVAVANAETADRLLPTAIDVASDRSSRIVITYVVEVPAQMPLSGGEEFLDDEDRAMLDRARATVDDAGIPVESRIRYVRNLATGIVSGAAEYGADLVLVGWRGRPARRNVVLGSYVDVVLRNAPCDVLVKRIRSPDPDRIDSILVPVSSGPHAGFATDIAGRLARQHDASITLVHVVPEDVADVDREAATALLDRVTGRIDDVAVERVVRESDHVSGALTDETTRHDVTVIGASEAGVIRRRLLGTVSEAVGRHAAGSVLIAQRHPSRADRVERRHD